MGNRRKREKKNHMVVEVGKNYEFIYIYIRKPLAFTHTYKGICLHF